MSEPIALPNVTFTAADRGGEYFAKLQQLAAAVDSSITAYNAAVAAGTDASGYLQEIQQLQIQINQALAVAIAEIEAIRDNTQAIAEGELPGQTGQSNKALITTGTTIGWSHVSGFNRFASAAAALEPGDRLMMTLTADVPLTLPSSITQGDPFVVRNSVSSTGRIALQINHALLTKKGELEPGDVVYIEPGHTWPMQALSETQLELLI